MVERPPENIKSIVPSYISLQEVNLSNKQEEQIDIRTYACCSCDSGPTEIKNSHSLRANESPDLLAKLGLRYSCHRACDGAKVAKRHLRHETLPAPLTFNLRRYEVGLVNF